MEIFRLNKFKGQTILEVVIALGAGIVVLSAMTVAVITSLNNASQATTESQANHFAQQGIEIMRNMRNNDYATLSNLSNATYCMADSCKAINSALGSCGLKAASCGLNVKNKYIREVSLTHNSITCLSTGVTPPPGSKQTYVKVQVSWTDNKCTSALSTYCHSVSVESCFSNYSGRTAP